MKINLNGEDVSRLTKFDTLNYHVLESMDDLVRIIDLEGNIIYENTAMSKAGDSSFLGVNCCKRNDDGQSLQCISEISKNQNRSISKEIYQDDKIYSAKSSPVYDEMGDMIALVEVFRDITIAKKIQIELFNANKKINDELILARNIQRAILPRKKTFENVFFDYAYIPSGNLSGDIFDVIEIDDNKLGIYIADVVGHGISASIMTMFIRQTMRNILLEKKHLGPSETMLELKSRFSELHLDPSQYFTIFYAVVDREKNEMIYVNAGHNSRPLMFNDQNIAFLHNRGKFISNIFPDEDYHEKKVEILAGYKFLFYTDGLLETANKAGEFYGEKNLMRWVKKNRNREDFIDSLVRELNAFRWLEQNDDIALLLMDVRKG